MTQRLARAASGRLHVLAVEPPGHFTTRIAVEHEVTRRGWVLAHTPAEADVLLVLGSPGPELRAAADRLHDAMPGPRARVDAPTAAAITDALEEASRLVADDSAQRADAHNRSPEPADHGDMDHGDMDHGDMDMAPGGIPLAGGGEDRDGLEMDELHLALGPVLHLWPPGLVLTCTLHGDVVVDATSDWVGEPAVEAATSSGQVPSSALCAASWLDAAATVLTLGGSPARAAAVRSARDACLEEDPTTSARLSRERRRIERSVLLRWSLHGVATVDDLTGQASLPFVGDAFTRLVASLDAAGAELAGDEVLTPEPAVLVDRLPAVVRGRELGEVRLLVAGLAPAFGPVAGRWASAHTTREAG
jgi:hypothetical protein